MFITATLANGVIFRALPRSLGMHEEDFAPLDADLDGDAQRLHVERAMRGLQHAARVLVYWPAYRC